MICSHVSDLQGISSGHIYAVCVQLYDWKVTFHFIRTLNRFKNVLDHGYVRVIKFSDIAFLKCLSQTCKRFLHLQETFNTYSFSASVFERVLHNRN